MKKELQTQVRKLEISIRVLTSLRENLISNVLLNYEQLTPNEYRIYIEEIETIIRDKQKEVTKRENLYR
jgi:hypothetical protein